MKLINTALFLALALVAFVGFAPEAKAQYYRSYSSGYYSSYYRPTYYPSYYSSYYKPAYYSAPSYYSSGYCEPSTVVAPVKVVVAEPTKVIVPGGGNGHESDADRLIKEILLRKLLSSELGEVRSTAPATPAAPATPPMYMTTPPAGGLTAEEVAKLREILKAIKTPPAAAPPPPTPPAAPTE